MTLSPPDQVNMFTEDFLSRLLAPNLNFVLPVEAYVEFLVRLPIGLRELSKTKWKTEMIY